MSPLKRKMWMKDNGIVPMIGGGTSYGMFEMARPFMNADAPAVTAAAKTALTQDTIMTLPGNYFDQVGKMVWFRVMGKVTTTAVPGTYLFTLSWGGSAGTTLVASGALTPVAAVHTDNLWYVDMWVKCVALVTGSVTGLTLLAYGRADMATGIVESTQALQDAKYMPPRLTAVANVAGLDGTVPKALTLSVTPSVATGSMAARDAWIVGPN